MATVLDQYKYITQEVFAPDVEESLPKIDKIARSIYTTSAGVERMGLGRLSGSSNKWGFEKTFLAGIGGQFGYRKLDGDALTIAGDGTSGIGASIYSPFTGTEITRGWAGPATLPLPATSQKVVTLKEGFGNFLVPLDMLRQDEFSSSLASLYSQLLKGAAMAAALGQMNAFWKVSTDGRIGAGTLSATTIPASSTPVTVTLTSGRIRSFYPGQLLDMYETTVDVSGRKTSDTQPVMVVAVAYKSNTIKVYSNAALAGLSSSATNIFVPWRVASGASSARTYEGPSGPEDWLIDTGTAFGINVASYPQHASVVATESGPLTDPILNQHVGRMVDAEGDEGIDSLITTVGVLLGYLENIDGLGQYQRNAQVVNPRAGFSGFAYTWNGTNIEFMTTPNVPTGVMYGLKLGDQNIKRHVPPRTPKTGSQSNFSNEVEFMAPLWGFNGIFTPVYISGAHTMFSQCPYILVHEFCPDKLSGIKISGLTGSTGGG